jgi:hypothetical protein
MLTGSGMGRALQNRSPVGVAAPKLACAGNLARISAKSALHLGPS